MKILQISRQLFIKDPNIKQLEDTLKQKQNTIDILKSNIKDNKKFIENNQNTKANEMCQPVPKTKALHHEKVPTKITENIANSKFSKQ